MVASCSIGLALALAPVAFAQPPTITFPGTTPAPSVPGAITPPAGAVNPYAAGGVPFDPYSPQGSAAYSFWSTNPPSNTAGAFGQPALPSVPGASPTATSPYLGPGYAPPAGQPQALFPNGMFGEQAFDYQSALRLIQDPRLRHTYLVGGEDLTDLGINDTEAAVTFTIPNFLTTGQPLYISPAFALHLWDGPKLPNADLPPNAYSAYLDGQWSSDPLLQIGAELGLRVGVYTGFNLINSHSLRVQGLALGTARLTPTLQAKLGVVYLNRNDIKILPAGGLLWTPTPQVRFDIFFPQPKLATYLTTVGRYEVWGYLAGEYGGGAWTIERADGSDNRIDINDVRVSLGIEWTGPRGFHGFVEGGYVFKRTVLYVEDPAATFHPDDTWMIRAGISY
ncbi:MAG: DUF6268 family outer membrane beta-barrel protein [Pirellulaceae bacterium]|nr:DUF6268 family outer membrane beta-barrel protein [Pirellulaceae bacterium]